MIRNKFKNHSAKKVNDIKDNLSPRDKLIRNILYIFCFGTCMFFFIKIALL